MSDKLLVLVPPARPGALLAGAQVDGVVVPGAADALVAVHVLDVPGRERPAGVEADRVHAVDPGARPHYLSEGVSHLQTTLRLK